MRQAFVSGAQGQRWDAVLAEAQALGDAVFNSSEYAARGRTNEQFVTDLYQAFLLREGEPEGVTEWVEFVVANGRAETVEHFSAGDELDLVASSLVPSERVSLLAVPRDGRDKVSYEYVSNRINLPGWEYDAAGNQTRTQRADGTWQRMEYDAANRLVKVTDDGGSNTLALYTYGDDNARLVTDEPGLRTYFAWVGGSVVAEYIETGGQTTPQWSKNYVYLGARLLATQTPATGDTEYVEYHHPDRLGTRIVTNATDTNYFEQTTLPFGTALDAESTGATNRRFTSYDRSPTTGLDYANNRYYDPLQGRFTQVDPIGADAVSLGDPQSWNMYSYVGNDPINRTDPDGLFFGKLFKWIGKALKWVAIAAAVAAAIISVYGAIAGVAAAKVWLTTTTLGKIVGFIAGLPNAIGGFIAGIPKTIAGIFSLAEAGTSIVAGIVGNAVLLSGGEVAGAVARHLQSSGQRRKLRREAERRAKAAAAEAARRAAEELRKMIERSKAPMEGRTARTGQPLKGEKVEIRARKADIKLPKNPSAGARFKFALGKVLHGFEKVKDWFSNASMIDPAVIAEIACEENPNGQTCRDFLIFLPPQERCRYVLCGE